MNIAVMLASDRDPRDLALAGGLLSAARRRGHTARLFLVGDATRLVEQGAELARDGVEVSLCEADAAMRGVHKTGQTGVFFGSLYDWARLAEDADRVISLA